MNKEWQSICSEHDILMDKNDDNLYRIKFNMIENKNNKLNIIDTIKQNIFFQLIYELNQDIIKEYISDFKNNKNNVVLTVINDNEIIDTKSINVNLNINYFFQNNKCEMVSSNDNSTLLSTLDNIYVNDFHLSITNDITTEILLTFSLDDDIFNSALEKIFIALYFKKIFRRLKLYFE